VICNGDEEVNALRSELSAAVGANPAVVQKHPTRESLKQASSTPAQAGKAKAPPSEQPLTGAARVSCFVRLASPDLEVAGLCRRG
jgi:hypothetical protein